MGNPRSSTPLNQDAAAYVRMSTEHQKYSTANQMDVIREFAKHRGLNITIIYSDEGKSGLSIHGREALARLIADVDGGKAMFGHILVYDVSRWGRFQDADESAYYEYACRRAGILVHYCAEQFDNDGTPLATIIKSIKRAMAGEFSRELSAKVFQGQCRLVRLGFRQGGKPGYGYSRMLVGESGVRKGILKAGEHKCIQTDHIILVPGPDAEVKTVRWIFRQFAEKGRTEAEIAVTLNRKRILNHGERLWSGTVIKKLLKNEKYIGHNVYHRTSCKLRTKHLTNPPEMWIRGENAFEGIVTPKLFEAAAWRFRERIKTLPSEEMLDRLREILAREGRLSSAVIKKAGLGVSRSALRRRFGNVGDAYSLIGYEPPIDYSYKETHRKLRRSYEDLIGEMRQRLSVLGCTINEDRANHVIIVNDQLRVSLVFCRHYTTGAGASRWLIAPEDKKHSDLILAARMNPSGDSVRDYYLLPSQTVGKKRIWLTVENGSDWDGYRFDSLDFLYSLVARTAEVVT